MPPVDRAISDIVLIVDDVPENLSLLHDALDETGYTVLVATNGESALQRARQSLPDVILLDAMMPGMDGFEMIRRLRANPDLSRMDIIVVSAIDREEVVKRGLPADITIFGKPIPFHEIKGFLLGRLAARQRSA